MTRQRTTAILALLFFQALAVCAYGADGTTTRQAGPPSNSLKGRRALQIQWDRASGFIPDVGALTDTLAHSDQVNALAKEILALPTLPRGALYVSSTSQGDVGASIDLDFALPADARPAAAEFLDALVNLARTQLKEQQLQWQDRQVELRAVAQKRESQAVDELRARIEARRDKAREVTGRLDVSPEAIRTAAAKLEDLRTMLELDAVGGAARRKGIEEGIAKISDREEKRVKENPAVVELINVVKAREQSLDRVPKMYDASPTSAADLRLDESAVA